MLLVARKIKSKVFILVYEAQHDITHFPQPPSMLCLLTSVYITQCGLGIPSTTQDLSCCRTWFSFSTRKAFFLFAHLQAASVSFFLRIIFTNSEHPYFTPIDFSIRESFVSVMERILCNYFVYWFCLFIGSFPRTEIQAS